MSKPQHIILDLDGTIIDSKNEILKTYNLVFQEVPPEVMPDAASLNWGLTLNALLKSVYGDIPEKIEQARKIFASVYDTSEYLETHLYEGVLETLSALKQAGHELYIATNKRLLPTKRILEMKQMSGLFSYIMANEMEPGVTPTKRQMIAELKQIGSFTEGYMVGDSVTDIQAGKDEKLVTVAVNYGYENKDVLAALDPTYSIDHFEKLYTFVVNGKV